MARTLPPADVARLSRPFRTAAAFRSWLERNHGRERELLVRCFRNAHAARGITYRQALDEALCFGWIDGVRRSIDGESYSVRFTPRKARSNWSRVNRKRAAELIAEKRMRPSGRAAFRARVASAYSFEARERQLSREFLRVFRAETDAWSFYSALPPWYRRATAFWVMSGKKSETRHRRFAQLVHCSALGKGIPGAPLTKGRRRGILA